MTTSLVNVPGLSYDLILGLVVSLLSNIFMKYSFANWIKEAVVLAVSIVAALAECYLTNSFDGSNISAAIVVVAGVAYTAYQTLLKGLGQAIQANVGITDKGPAPAPDPITPIPIMVVPTPDPIVITPIPSVSEPVSPVVADPASVVVTTQGDLS